MIHSLLRGASHAPLMCNDYLDFLSRKADSVLATLVLLRVVVVVVPGARRVVDVYFAYSKSRSSLF